MGPIRALTDLSNVVLMEIASDRVIRGSYLSVEAERILIDRFRDEIDERE